MAKVGMLAQFHKHWAADPEVKTLSKADRSRPTFARLCVLQLGVNVGAGGMELPRSLKDK